MPVDLVRDAAVDVLLRVFEEGAYIKLALDRKLQRRKMSPRGRRFLTQLVYGTARHRLLCDHVLKGIVRDPLEELPRPIHTIMRMGVFQALFLKQVTFPAMVHTAVDLAKRKGHAGTARLVNACLKRVPQSIEDVALPDPEADPFEYLSLRYSMPRWLVESWAEQFGLEQARAMAAACAEEAPQTLRVNLLRTSPERLITTLARYGCAVEKQTRIPEEVTVLDGPPPSTLKPFAMGDYFVQDTASMLPPHLLEPQPGERILDLCAAPGGKATHIAELTRGEATVIALELQPKRVDQIRQNIERLGVKGVRVCVGNGLAPPFTGRFDRVLVDAPCSGLGTLRRRPELKWRAAPDDAARFARTQRRLLRSAIRLCENNGLIVYSVCSITREETVDVIQKTLEQGGVTPEDGVSWLAPWKVAPGQYRTLPGIEGMDGFFLTRLRKRS